MNKEKREQLDVLTYRILDSINDFTNTYQKTKLKKDRENIVYEIHKLSESLQLEYHKII